MKQFVHLVASVLALGAAPTLQILAVLLFRAEVIEDAATSQLDTLFVGRRVGAEPALAAYSHTFRFLHEDTRIVQ